MSEGVKPVGDEWSTMTRRLTEAEWEQAEARVVRNFDEGRIVLVGCSLVPVDRWVRVELERKLSGDGGVCGETRDHEQRVTYEDDEVVNYVCDECGAEWWEDKGDGGEGA